MSAKIKIGILGLGGVGGYFGGLLAKKYFQSNEVEIIFIARPSTEKIIYKNGLKLILPDEEIIVHPSFTSSDPEKIGTLDFLICAVKSYDLEQSLHSISKCISSTTVILPLLNGVDAPQRISEIFPKAEVWEGCAYLIARRIEPGVIKKTGNVHSLHFGSSQGNPDKQDQLHTIFLEAGIASYLVENITQTIWEKFIFISSIASLTSYLDITIGKIFENPEHKKLLVQLLTEVKSLADAKKIPLTKNIIETTLSKMERLPYETTSSMHSDFKAGNNTEYISLTAYVVNEAQKLKIEVPLYIEILKVLEEKMKSTKF